MNDFENILNSIEKKINILRNGSESQGLQRSEEWFEQRRGKFTGSRIKDLMACDRSASKMEWGRPEKILAIGEKAKKYIYEKAMERKTGKIIKIRSTAAMRYGTENEEIIKNVFLNQNKEYDFFECGFMAINEYLGASPDGELINTDNGLIYGMEIKAASSWSGFFDRTELPLEEKHIDFWQVQTEMMAFEHSELIYVVAEPSENISDPVIEKIIFQKVKESKIHQNAILQRAKLANEIIELYLDGIKFHNAIEISCRNFKPE